MSLFPFKDPQKNSTKKLHKNQAKTNGAQSGSPRKSQELKHGNATPICAKPGQSLYPVQNTTGLEIDCQEFGGNPKQASRWRVLFSDIHDVSRPCQKKIDPVFC